MFLCPPRKYEKCDRTIRHLENTIKEKDGENDRLEGRIVELEVRIGKLNTEKYKLCQEFEKTDGEKKELNATIESLRIKVQSYESEIEKQKEELEERIDAMKQMQTTLMKKGEQNKRLSETVNTIKNQLLEEQIFDQKFIVSQAGALKSTDYIFKFVRDRSEAGEFFLEISSNAPQGLQRSRRRICIIDIEEIEPMQGIKFALRYHARPTLYDQLSFKRDKTLKTEYFTSRHLAQIMDGHMQVTKLFEENERQLDMFLAQNPDHAAM